MMSHDINSPYTAYTGSIYYIMIKQQEPTLFFEKRLMLPNIVFASSIFLVIGVSYPMITYL